MNKHILLIMDHHLSPGKYTEDQLRHNTFEAKAAADAADADIAAYADDAYDPAYYADYAYDAAYDIAYADDAAYWLDEYFKRSNESKQDYIDEINKGNSK